MNLIALTPEIQLIQKATAGDADAFARLYDTYVDEVYRFVYYRVSDEDTAEDLTSQIFFKAWDNLHRYQVRGSPFKAWLFQIARNLVIDYYRTRKEVLPLEPHALLEPDPAANVSEKVEQRLEAERLRNLLQGLTDDQREVLTLKYINGLSTKEIAKVMKKGQGAIRALQMRGLQALADMVGTDDEE
jgi:RNA polymerase sigma-70 factor (ECF subfamily)